MRALACSLLVVLLVCGAAADPFFTQDDDVVKPSGPGGYYRSHTKTVHLQQQNMKSCRYSGCGGEFGGCFSSLFTQTDFGCSGKDYHQNPDRFNTPKAASCDWDFTLQKWYAKSDANEDDLTFAPVLTADGNALRFATVSGVCYFSKTDDCEGPLCDRMVLNINGGVYVVRSYSRTPSVGYLGLGGDVEETCAGEVPNLPGWPIPWDRSGSRTNGTKSGSKQEAGTKQEPGVFIDNIVALVDYLLDLSEPVLFPNGPPSPSSDPEQGLYPGMAIIVTGPFSVSSMHSLDYSDTGVFNWVYGNKNITDYVVPRSEDWPIVQSGEMKLTFATKENTHYSGDSAPGEGRY